MAMADAVLKFRSSPRRFTRTTQPPCLLEHDSDLIGRPACAYRRLHAPYYGLIHLGLATIAYTDTSI